MEKIKDFVIKYKEYFISFGIALAIGYFFTAQRRIYVKNTIEVDLQLDSSVVDDIDTLDLSKDTINEN